MIFVFLILDFNTFYFMEDLPENHVFYVTGASSLKIVFIIFIITSESEGMVWWRVSSLFM